MPIEDPRVGVGLQSLAKVVNDGTRESQAAITKLFTRAVHQRRAVIMRYTGHRRLVYPHRIWQRDVPGQIYLFECWQEEGQSDWEKKKKTRRRCRRRCRHRRIREEEDHVQMWFTFMSDRVDSAELTDEQFEVREDFVEHTLRRFGRLVCQVTRKVIKKVKEGVGGVLDLFVEGG